MKIIVRVTSSTDALGHTTSKAYDANGNEISSTDADGNQTTYSYDPANEQTGVNRPDHTTLTTAYTPDGSVAPATMAHASDCGGEVFTP